MSDVVAPAGGGGSTPATPATGDAGAQVRMRNAVAFLNNAQVRASPLVRRVNFLKSKGMPAAEIVEAFRQANQPQTLEVINDILSGKTSSIATTTAGASGTSATPAPPTAAPPAPSAPATPPPPHAYPAPPHQPYPYPPPYPYPYPPPPPPPNAPPVTPPGAAKTAEGWTWKDYFIGTTVAVVGAAAAVKAFVVFSPYDIVRKDDRSLLPPALVASQSRVSATLPVLAPPVVPQLPAPRAESAVSVEQQAAATKSAGEIDSLKEQLEKEQKAAIDLKADLDKVRKEKAELAVTVGKIKGQMASLQRASERAELTLESRVQERLAEQRRALAPDAPAPDAAPSTVTTTEVQPAPPSAATASVDIPPAASAEVAPSKDEAPAA